MLCFLVFASIFVFQKSRADALMWPGVYGTLGVVPGLGHVAQGDLLEGVGWFGATVLLMGSGNGLLSSIGFNVWMYNMYDAYKDAGAQKTVQESIYQNYFANFQLANIKDPIGAPIVAVGAIAGAGNGFAGLKNPVSWVKYTFVGLGEEALFRGFLYPGMSSILFGSEFLGALTSAALFSAAHNNKTSMEFTIRYIAGLLFCWQASRNKYDLRKNIFAHSWYDVFVAGGAEVPVYGAKFSLRY